MDTWYDIARNKADTRDDDEEAASIEADREMHHGDIDDDIVKALAADSNMAHYIERLIRAKDIAVIQMMRMEIRALVHSEVLARVRKERAL